MRGSAVGPALCSALTRRPTTTSHARSMLRNPDCRSAALALLVVLVGTPAARAEMATPPTDRWDLSVGSRVGIPGGWVKVGENDVPGTRLRFRKDLGIDHSEAVDLSVGYHLDNASALRLSLESLFLDGSTTLGRDVSFNGTTLQGGTRLETRTHFPDFLRIGVSYERHLATIADDGNLYWNAGLTYVLLTFRVHGTLAASSKGHETKEDFLTQELPVPIVGVRGEYPLADRLSATAAFAGGYLPRVDSLRSEGGDVKLNQAHADVGLGLAYELSPAIRLEGGYQYTYFFQLEKSREDDNVILLSENALSVSLSCRF
jgi:Outer membrane protein beta-barrel domain